MEQHLCPGCAPPSYLLGLLPFISPSWGSKRADSLSKGSPAPASPSLGVLGEVSGGGLEPLLTRGQAPGSQAGGPRPVETWDVCACACKCGCLCVRSLLVSLGK